MITEERLKELIEQGAVIYNISKEIFIAGASDFLKIVEVPSGLFSQEINDSVGCQPDYNLLFETKEEAEWYLEFGNITRIETLKLPTWKEFKKNKRFIFISTNHTWYEIIIFKKKIFWNYADDEYWADYEDWKPVAATKENYVEACRLAKKLFLGEIEND